MEASSQRHTVSVGDLAPDFTLPDVNGKPRSLSDYRGKKVMLSFHRFASCPFCNFAIDQLKGRHKKLAWAAKLEVIKIFQSPEDSIEKYVLRDDDASEYPFILLSDTEHRTFETYKIQRSLLGVVSGIARAKTVKRHSFRDLKRPTKSNYKSEGIGPKQMCADFLIDEDGKVVDCFRAKSIEEHIPVDRVDLFLLGDAIAKSQRSSSLSGVEQSSMKKNRLNLSFLKKSLKEEGSCHL